jgi:hypothetical protein
MGSKSRGKRAKGQGAKKALPDSGPAVNCQTTAAEWRKLKQKEKDARRRQSFAQVGPGRLPSSSEIFHA